MKLVGKIILSLCIILFSFTVAQAEIAVYDANNQFIGYLLGTQYSFNDIQLRKVQIYVPSLAKLANFGICWDLDSGCSLGKLDITDRPDIIYEISGCIGVPYLYYGDCDYCISDAGFYNIFYNGSGKYYIVDSVTVTSRQIYSKGSSPSYCFSANFGMVDVVRAREVSLPFSLPLMEPLKFSIETPKSKETFQWPVDPNKTSTGHYGSCSEWVGDPGGCYWLGDLEDINVVWRDVQPFQLHDWGSRGYHLGADYNLGNGAYDKGKLVYPAANGIISMVKSNQCGYGNIIFVLHNTSFGVYTSMYAHVDWLNGVPPQVGNSVTMDKPIARVGNGSWNNPSCNNQSGQWPYHLHFEIREGDNTINGNSYTQNQVEKGPQGQINPNAFISAHN